MKGEAALGNADRSTGRNHQDGPRQQRDQKTIFESRLARGPMQ